MNPEIVVIIPAFNEEASLPQVIQGIRRSLPQADIVVVNDGSQDRTHEVTRMAGARVLDHPFNLGYGVALQTGFKYALRYGYGFVVQMDGDGQHDPTALPDLLRVVQRGEADVAIGSRFMYKGTYKTPTARRIGAFLFGRVASWITGQRVTDPTSGFQVLNRDVVRFYAGKVYPVDYPDADVVIMLRRTGFRIQEVPVTMYARQAGKSMHSGIEPFYYLFKMCLSIFVTLLRRDHVMRENHATPATDLRAHS